MSVVSNTTVLSNFASIGQLAVLRHLFGVVFVPTEVFAEIEDAQREGYTLFAGIEQHTFPLVEHGWLHLISLDETELRLTATLSAGLHRGERSCLSIAIRRDWLMLSDDRAARAEARLRQARFSGSIGCLVLAVERGLVPLAQANEWLSAMIAQGYYAPLTDLSLLVNRRPAEIRPRPDADQMST